jgi:3-oxoacyl-[acyl-carrier protein] reductase
MDLGLQGAKVLVTAASEGLGAATARRFSLEGAQVVISSRSLPKLQETAASIVEESGNPVFTHAADMRDAEAVRKLVDNAVTMLDGLDILITNAGGPPAGNFEDFNLQDWQDATQLTLHSHISAIQAALPTLKTSQRGAILAIVSIAAKEPVEQLTLSNTLRPAVVGLTKTLSFELGQDRIRVNSILPGMTQTGRVDKLLAARADAKGHDIGTETEQAAKNIPLGRIGTPEEFANTAVFMCSPAGGFINGVSWLVDGGASKGSF